MQSVHFYLKLRATSGENRKLLVREPAAVVACSNHSRQNAVPCSCLAQVSSPLESAQGADLIYQMQHLAACLVSTCTLEVQSVICMQSGRHARIGVLWTARCRQMQTAGPCWLASAQVGGGSTAALAADSS